MAAGVLAFFFFSGELSKAVPSSSFSEWLIHLTPQLNYYLIPVAVCCSRDLQALSCRKLPLMALDSEKVVLFPVVL